MKDNHGRDQLTPSLVWSPDNSGLEYGRMLLQHLLHLVRVNVEPSGNDHFVLPINQEKESLVIESSDVAGVNPPATHYLEHPIRGLLPVAAHVVVSPND